jgi:hypothetical protein
MEDFSKDPGGQDFNKLKSQYSLFVDALGSNQVFQYVYHMRLLITVSIVTDNIVYVVSFWVFESLIVPILICKSCLYLSISFHTKIK